MSLKWIVVVVLGFGSVSSSVVQAKTLVNRLGVGYRNQFATDLPGLAAQYYPSDDVALGASLGLQTGSNDSKFGLLFRVHRIVFPEENLNFYMGLGAGLLSTKIAGVNDSGFELQGFMGAEFFLPGLDSLALYTDAGVGIVSTSAGVTFRTLGDSPLRAGMLFFF